nr:MAG TPA: hypothetical protein [Caudoviricetes sp.]
MDGMIRAGKLCEFVEGLVKRYNDEQREKVIWEIWLHRVFDKSFPEFVEELEKGKEKPVSNEQVLEIVENSKTILGTVIPMAAK